MSYYVKKLLDTKTDAHFKFQTKQDCWNYVRENIVSFIYTVNQPNRSGLQSPFTNISLYDRQFLTSLKDNYIFPDGSTPDLDVVDKIQELYMSIMNDELSRTPITFPVTTACFAIDKKNEIQDKTFLSLIARYNKKFGYINIFCGESSVLSSCCRLRSDTKSEYFNSFGAGSTKIGSLGVVTINLPRLAIKYKYDEDKFFDKLREYVKIVSMINNCKRKLVQKRIDNGNHPLYDHKFIELDKQYSTCGVNGLNECIEELGYNILTDDGQALVLDIIKVINEENSKYEKQYGTPHNCEQVPGENLSIKLCNKDKLLKYHDKYELYSNQFIPLTTNADVLDRIALQGKFDKHFSGGAVCHVNVDTEIKDEKRLEELIVSCAKQGVVYWAINYNLQECEDHHMSVGRNETCSICGKKIIGNYTRVVGFLTNVKNWHEIRRTDDYPNRKWYNGEIND
jgi:ribonucleoside-triphosphate reductase